MGAALLGQQEWGLGEKYGWPAKYGVWSRGPVGVMFLAWASIFSYWGLNRDHEYFSSSSGGFTIVPFFSFQENYINVLNLKWS